MTTTSHSPPGATLVTGGSAGIGRAVCQALLTEGRTVFNLDRDPAQWSHPNLVSVACDLTNAGQTEEVARHITESHAITGLVNNAGATRPGSVDTATLQDLDHLVALHLKASLILVQASLPALRASRRGRIVNVSSRAALGKAERVVYSVTKAGLIGLTRTLALELGGDGITVNAVAPGPIDTELFRRSNPAGAAQTRRILDGVLVGRMGSPEDVARAVLFFLSADNGFVTGQVLYVCGGTSLGIAPI